MENHVALMAIVLSYLHALTDSHDVAATRVRFYVDELEAELEPRYVMGGQLIISLS